MSLFVYWSLIFRPFSLQLNQSRADCIFIIIQPMHGSFAIIFFKHSNPKHFQVYRARENRILTSRMFSWKQNFKFSQSWVGKFRHVLWRPFFFLHPLWSDSHDSFVSFLKLNHLWHSFRTFSRCIKISSVRNLVLCVFISQLFDLPFFWPSLILFFSH